MDVVGWGSLGLGKQAFAGRYISTLSICSRARIVDIVAESFCDNAYDANSVQD